MPEVNKYVWAARLLAVILLLVFTFLFWNLYSNLRGLRQAMTESTPVEQEER